MSRIWFGRVKILLNNIISHPKKCKGRESRLDLENRNRIKVGAIDAVALRPFKK